MCEETRKLISIIETYECIWKKAFRTNLMAKERAWDEVAEKMYGAGWKSFSSSKKLTAKTDLRKRWKNIKDYFTKAFKRQQHNNSIGLSHRKSKYIFADSLKFLFTEPDFQSHVEFVDSDSHSNTLAQDPLREDNDCDTYSVDTGCDSPSTSKDDEGQSFIPKSSSTINRSQNKTKLTSVKFRSKLLKLLDQQKNEKADCSHDDDESFFHSLLPIVRKFDEQQKIQFRMDVLNCVRNIRTPGAAPQQSTISVGQTYYPLTQHQLQIYSVPSNQTEIQAGSNNSSQQPSNVANVSSESQVEHVSITDGLDSEKNQVVEVYSDVL